MITKGGQVIEFKRQIESFNYTLLLLIDGTEYALEVDRDEAVELIKMVHEKLTKNA